jgi:hypothetical protein
MCCCRQSEETTCFLQGIIDGTKLSLQNKSVLHAKNITARSVGRPTAERHLKSKFFLAEGNNIYRPC